MSRWSTRHAAALNALRWDEVTPMLFRRLSGDQLSLDDAEVAALRDWGASLHGDAGWREVEPLLEEPSAWPGAWERATSRGWSGRTHHHNALVLERITLALARRRSFEAALVRCRWSIDSWEEALGSDHIAELADSVDIPASEACELALTSYFDELFDIGVEAIGADEAAGAGSVDRPAANFAWQALGFADSDDGSAGADADISELAESRRQGLRHRAIAALERRVEQLDVLEDSIETLLEPFEWFAAVFEGFDVDARVATEAVDLAVDVIWKLRRTEDDDDRSKIPPIVEIVRPFGHRLETFVARGEAFGRHSLCSDFLVFVGEQFDDTEKRTAHFERALEICPDHRNASMMLSYESLRRAHQLLAGLGLIPGPLARLPQANERIRKTLREADDLVERAAELFPPNEDVAEYRSEVRETARRFDVQLHSM